MATHFDRALALDVDIDTVRGLVLVAGDPAVPGGYAQIRVEPGGDVTAAATRVAGALDPARSMPIVVCVADVHDAGVGEAVVAALVGAGFPEAETARRDDAVQRVASDAPVDELRGVSIPAGLLASHDGLVARDLAAVAGAALGRLEIGAAPEPRIDVWTPERAHDAPPTRIIDPFTSQRSSAAGRHLPESPDEASDDDATVDGVLVGGGESPDEASDDDAMVDGVLVGGGESPDEASDDDAMVDGVLVGGGALLEDEATVDVLPNGGPAEAPRPVEPAPSAEPFGSTEVSELGAVAGAAVAEKPKTEATNGERKRRIGALLVVAVVLLIAVAALVSQCGADDTAVEAGGAPGTPSETDPTVESDAEEADGGGPGADAQADEEAPQDTARQLENGSTDAQESVANAQATSAPEPTATSEPPGTPEATATSEPTVASQPASPPEPPEPTVDALEDLPPLSSLPERGAIFRPPTLFLQGPVQTQEQADALYEAAVAVVGPDNVVNEYIVRPDAPAAIDGNVRVEQAVLFESGSALIAEEFVPTLELGVAVMALNPQVQMIIEGHTDSVGSDASNLALSQRRADAVLEYLVGRGVDPARLAAVGRGESQPVDTNDTAAGRQINRRIEVALIGLLATE